MEVSLNCLKQFVDLEGLSVEEIAHGFTFAGIEVEGTRPLAYGTKLCIGEVLTCEEIEGTHLHVLSVNLGQKYGTQQIVCGAPNVRSGLKVVVALEGCELIGGKIGKSTIRGVESHGMCCSYLELGLDRKYLSDKDLEGIIELDSAAPVGEENVLHYLLLDDYVLSLSVLANRPDLLSILNIAKEAGAIFSRPTYPIKVEHLETYKTDFKVGSETEKCPQFSGKEIKGIKSGSSPLWMQRYLMAMGVRSIDNIVDIGNYVMLITGQPLHMYDVNKLPERKLVARDDYEGSFVALDTKSYDVIKGDICICSKERAMCLGGVMGSLECAVDSGSTDIVIEAASFYAVTIRHTSTRLGLSSESSSRFVKGTNHFQSEFVIDYASSLIKQLCGGEQFSQTIIYQSEKEKPIQIETTYEKINSRLATSFSPKEIKGALERLNFKVTDKGNKFICTVPSYRLDIERWEDLSEEVIRLLGYEHVPSILPTFESSEGSLSESAIKINLVSDYLLNQGLDECLSYTLLSEKEYDETFTTIFDHDAYKVMNPLTDDHVVVRTSLAHSMMKNVIYNISRQTKDMALFEISEITTKNSYTHHLCIALVNDKHEQGLLVTRPYDFYDLKGLVCGIFETLGVDASRYKIVSNDQVEELHPGKSALITIAGKTIGYFGELHPTTITKYDLGKNNVLLAEVVLDDIFALKVSTTKMEKISKYPTISHDLALIVSKEVTSQELLHLITKTANGIVTSCEVFDVYEGKGIASGTKSVAITITYGSDTHTLEDKEVTQVEDNIKFELNRRFKAVLRS
ncbi:MAG: phenylalanine--tRNA ligase subunit beta [Coprobacillus sp.]|nr:phenylalanine--tRNA ligase subunit beta [Coprobacillus sp.]